MLALLSYFLTCSAYFLLDFLLLTLLLTQTPQLLLFFLPFFLVFVGKKQLIKLQLLVLISYPSIQDTPELTGRIE